MATSGTVATTLLDTATVIEHALRRCGIGAAKQTPELVQSARESLYMFMLSLANRGLNLWCVERQLIGFTAGQATYQANAGTLDVLSVTYSTPTLATGVDSTTTTTRTTTLNSSASIVRVGVKFSIVPASGTLSINRDGAEAVSIARTDWQTGLWYWLDIPIIADGIVYDAEFSTAVTFSEVCWASAVRDLPVSPWNRDTWMSMNNKVQAGSPSTSYFFEKKLTPQVTLWPVPNDGHNHMTLMCHRQFQDVGTLSQQIEVPQRWIEAISWHLALRIGLEMPEGLVSEARLTLLSGMADKHVIEAEGDEVDSAPINLMPNLRGYTR